jgi:hypothetical protein
MKRATLRRLSLSTANSAVAKSSVTVVRVGLIHVYTTVRGVLIHI